MKKPEKPPKFQIDYTKYDETLHFLIDATNRYYERLDKVEEDYPYWDKFKQKVKDIPYDTERLWEFIKEGRRRGKLILLYAGNGDKVTKISRAYNFRYNTTDNIELQLHQFDLGMGGILYHDTIIPEEDKEKYLGNSLMEEAIASSQIEGAATTREVAKEMLLNERRPRTHSEKMIVNNYNAIKKIREWKGLPITKERILELHAIVTHDTLTDKEEGAWRASDKINVVDETGEVFYTPPEYKYVDALMDTFCEFANEKGLNKGFIHPVIRAIILHFLIGYIHPFADGNGRTARAIFYWYLINKGYWMIEYMPISRIILRAPAKYARAYLHTEYDDNDLTYFIKYNLDAMEAAKKELGEYVERKLAEKKQMHTLLVDTGLNDRQLAVLKDAMDDPEIVVTIKEVQNKYGVVYQTARTDMMSLTEKGYFDAKTIGKKMVFYRSKQFDKLIKKK